MRKKDEFIGLKVEKREKELMKKKAKKLNRSLSNFLLELWRSYGKHLIFVGLILYSTSSCAEIQDKVLVRCIIGEAANQGDQGMYAVASGILNRGTIKGVYGCNAKFIDKEPQWVFEKASKALTLAKQKRLHSGTHWENIKQFGTPYWADSMIKVYAHKDHIFYLERNVK